MKNPCVLVNNACSTTQKSDPLQTPNIQLLNLLPRPGRFAQKGKARLDARVFGKAVDSDAPAQFLPPKMSDEVVEDGLQGFAVQRIVRSHGVEYGCLKMKPIVLTTEDGRRQTTYPTVTRRPLSVVRRPSSLVYCYPPFAIT